MEKRWGFQDYLQHAQEAEACAAATTDPFLKEQWHQIAVAYTELAQTRLAALKGEHGAPIAGH